MRGGYSAPTTDRLTSWPSWRSAHATPCDSLRYAWEHVGIHPFRGEVTLQRWVQEINERDLDAMWRLQRLREALLPAGIDGVD